LDDAKIHMREAAQVKSMLRHQIGAVFAALSAGWGAAVSAQPMAAAPLALSPSAALSLHLGAGASAHPKAAPSHSRMFERTIPAPAPVMREEDRSATAAQGETGPRTVLAPGSAAAEPNKSTANPAAVANATPADMQPRSSARQSIAAISSAARRAGTSVSNMMSKLFSSNPN
jgi:hypothetical protein